jgi:hypothetical protein
MLNKKALAASVSAPPAPFVEDVFSTFLYTGNATAKSIVNDIDLAGKGGLVWIKERDDSRNHFIYDSARGAGNYIQSNTTAAQVATDLNTLSSFNSNGFSLGDDSNLRGVNRNPSLVCSWTFREQPKFFDIVTYTGTGANRTISHNLGSAPGMMIIKRTDTTGNWAVYHRSLGNSATVYLNLTDASGAGIWNATTPTSTGFRVGTSSTVNANGGTYVAYLFAHDAGGFGTAGTDNVISCGSYTSNATTPPEITLGWEPQIVMVKNITMSGDDWVIEDTMRGMDYSKRAILNPNQSSAEQANPASGTDIIPTATGFRVTGTSSNTNDSTGRTHIYIAIRRPMKVPTIGTEVFAVDTDGLSLTNGVAFNSGFPVDMAMSKERAGTDPNIVMSRLTGNGQYLETTNANAEASGISFGTFNHQLGWYSTLSANCSWMFRRALGFFDQVCYTGTSVDGGGPAQNVTHNLGVVPELIIIKSRSNARSWQVYSATEGNAKRNELDNAAFTSTDYWDSTTPTSTTFRVKNDNDVNGAGFTYVAYLFATLAGVSKVGSYTGNGSSQTINCGFTGGARFVLIKRTDSTGDWVVLDTARGIVSGNDPFLQLNSTAAEITNEDIVDPDSSGFVVNSTTENINASGATYIFLAVA